MSFFERFGVMCLARLLICALMLASTTCLHLDISTKKPRVTKYSRTTPLPGDPSVSLAAGNLVGPATTPSSSFLYRVNSTSGATCILLKTDGLLSIKYNNKLGERIEANIFFPETGLTTVTGNCKYEDTETMTMTFKGFKIVWNFAKTPGGERWYVARVQVMYGTDNSVFEHVAVSNLKAELSTKDPALLFPTPVGKSYACLTETTVLMENQDKDSPLDHQAVLLLRDFQLQAFMYKAKNAFGPQFQCSLTGSLRDETTPIAVGATLSIAVLFTVTGYGIFRYLKVKKVQYDTME